MGKVIVPNLTIFKEEKRVLESGKIMRFIMKDYTSTAIARMAQEVAR